MKCSCQQEIPCTAETYRGTQFYRDKPGKEPYLVLALFNCPACASTRAAILYDGTNKEEGT